jgi:hypothetical protein
VVLEANTAAEGGGVEVEQGAKLGAPGDDEVGREQRRGDVVVGVEGLKPAKPPNLGCDHSPSRRPGAILEVPNHNPIPAAALSSKSSASRM